MKYTRSRCALIEFSPGTPAGLQVFSRRKVGLATSLRLAAEQLKITRVLDVLRSNFRQARPRRFRYSQDAQSAWQLFCDWLPSCCKIHTLSTTFTACSVSFSTCLFAAIAYFPWRRHLVQFFSAAAAQVTANWLKPLKVPECAACTRRVGQLELRSNVRSCAVNANFLIPTTPIS